MSHKNLIIDCNQQIKLHDERNLEAKVVSRFNVKPILNVMDLDFLKKFK